MSLKSEPFSDHKTRSAVVTKAFINAVKILEVTTPEIRQLIGASPAMWSLVVIAQILTFKQ